jgi:hypothetical protein
MMRSHFGFVVNAGDPGPCETGYVPTTRLPSPGAVANANTDAVRCDVVNGRDPQPGDDDNESGSNIRGEQNIGRAGGTGSGQPQSGQAGQPPVGSILDDVLGGILHANPFASTLG